MMLENIARRLEDGAKGNTGEAKTNEVGVLSKWLVGFYTVE